MKSDLDGLSILILEDEAFIGMAISEFMTRAGARKAEVACNIGDAKRLVADLRFDIAILDMHLPDGTPLYLAKQLAQSGTKLIFHSGLPIGDAIMTEFPHASFCQKPCAPAKFVDTIRDLHAMS